MRSLGSRRSVLSVFLTLAAVLSTCSVIAMFMYAGMTTTVTVASAEQQHRSASRLCDSTGGWRCIDEDPQLNLENTRGGDETVDSEEERREEERVVGRIETCLLATNMSEYLERKGSLSNAYDNARSMIRTLRTIIPRKFSSDYLSPCWEADFKGSVHREDETVKWVVDGKEIVTPFSALITGSAKKLASHAKLGPVSSPLICLPKIFSIGFAKCGTGYLHCVMGRRFEGGPGVQSHKEPRWWMSDQVASMLHSRKPAVEYIPPYLFNYINVARALSSSHYQSKDQQPVAIDGSPNMLYSWPQLQNGNENYCLIPAVLSEVLPDSKYVVIMRNPVDRLYSSFWFSCHHFKNATLYLQNLSHPGPDVFHERITHKVNEFVKCTKFHPIAVCINEMTLSTYHDQHNLHKCGKTALEVVLYYFHIQKWLSVIPRDNFVFLTMRELSSNISYVEEEILTLLGSARPYNLTLKNEDLSTCKTNYQSSYRDDPRMHMREDTRKMLTEFFKPYNRMLADLLGDEKFLWEN